MTDKPDYGTILFDLLTKAENGDAAPFDVRNAAIADVGRVAAELF